MIADFALRSLVSIESECIIPIELTYSDRGRTPAMATQFVKSERLRKLPPYLFAEIDKKKKAAIAAGRDVINLGVGDPDRPTPDADHPEPPAPRREPGVPPVRPRPGCARAAGARSRRSARSGTASTSIPRPRSWP